MKRRTLFFLLFWFLAACSKTETAVPPTASPTLTPESPNTLPLQTWAKIEPGGDTRCAHNTPYAYWVRPGLTPKLLLYFEGGGGCWSAETCAPGSSLYDDAVDASDNPELRGGVLDFANPENPFWDYTAVYIPVCTGDVHWGNNVQTYTKDDGSELTIYHRGFINAQTALEWAYTNLPQPESIFMTGCSAGSVGSIAHAPYVIEQYPDISVAQLGDSLSFVFHRPLDLQVDYHVHDNFASWIPALTQIIPGNFLMSDYYSAVANHYPAYTFAQYNTEADQVQEQFYVAVGGEADNFPNDLAESLSQIHTQATNFRSYTAEGTLHCITPRSQFYTLETNGVQLRDWVAGLAAGQPAESVTCDSCAVQAETAVPTASLAQPEVALTPSPIHPFTAAPSPRAGHELVYHDQLQMVLLVNGDTGDPADTQTPGVIWGWGGEQWQVVSDDAPLLRSIGGVAYDSGRQVLVLYGGYTPDECYTDTWEWDTVAWQKLDVVGPGVCDHFAMTYDAARGKVVLYGGQDPNYGIHENTWTWDGQQWEQVSTEGPPARAHYALTYDSTQQKVLLFGGFGGQDLDDFWAWDGTTWQEITADAPSSRAGVRMAFNEEMETAVLFGGGFNLNGLSDTWLWDGVAWTEVPGDGPSARCYHAMAYDPIRHKIILFGGQGSDGNLLNDTWEWDGGQWHCADGCETPDS